MPPTQSPITNAAIALELKLEAIIETLFNFLTQQWVIVALANLFAGIIVLVRSKTGKQTDTGAGDKSAPYDPRAGITIINNLRCCRACTRCRKTTRCRKARYARRKSLRRRMVGDEPEA